MTPRSVLRSVLAFLAAAALLVGPAGGAALAAPTVPQQPSDAGWSEGESAQSDGTTEPESDGKPQFLALSIDSVAPTTVTSASSPFLVVGATVRNVGDRDVTDVDVRIQRGPAIAQSSGLRTVLQLDQANFEVAGDFVTVADRLGVGQSTQFTLTIPLREGSATRPGEPTLDIDRPGVYPLLLNVNGSPEYGDPARLDDARFLLPVLGLPPVSNPRNPDDGRAVDAPRNAPIAMTMLWPLADRPRLAAGQPGSLD
ncbi:MAG: glycoprotein, partial [Aldersonia sp.]|nr:glycoprotein [Aldersonia sp.]